MHPPVLEPAKVLAAVLREIQRPHQVVHTVLVDGVHHQPREVERASRDRSQAASVAYDLPRLAAVVGAHHDAVFGLDHRINHLGIPRREGEPHATELAFRETFSRTQPLPALATVVGNVELPWCINTGKSLIPLTLRFLAQKRNLLIPLELSRVMHQGRKEAARGPQNRGQGYRGVAG